MITVSNTVEAPLTDIVIKGKTINDDTGIKSSGIDIGNGMFKIIILTNNGLNTSDDNYKENIYEIILPCQLGSTLDGKINDLLYYDYKLKKLIVNKKTSNGELLKNPKVYELNTQFNLISFNGNTTIKVDGGVVNPVIKANVSKSLSSSNSFIVEEMSKIKDFSNTNANEIEHLKDAVSSKVEKEDLDNKFNKFETSSNAKYLGKTEKAASSSSSDSVPWDGIMDKPKTFTPSIHDHDLVTTVRNGYMYKEDKVKLDEIENNANHYIHPNDSNTRHVTDSEKANWNAKPTTTDVDNRIKALIGAAPTSLDTLKELADALNNDPNFAANIINQLGQKAPLVHNHDTIYSKLGHTHDDRYYTESECNSKFLGKSEKASSASSADTVNWAGITNKPSTFTPSTHIHDDRYYTASEADNRFLKTYMGNVSDFNLCINTGIYNVSGTGIPNAPIAGTIYGSLEVIPRANSITDVIQRLSTSGGELFTRFYGNDSIGWRPWVKTFNSMNKPTWNDIDSKPSSFTPSSHNHDDRYYTETEVNTQLSTKVSCSDYTLTTITKNLKVGTDWIDVGISGSNLETGSYVVQISGIDSSATSLWSEVFTGFMSWYSGTTNNNDSDEIVLHKAGHASNSRTIYLRTIRSANNGVLKLQISASQSFNASNYTFKFRKII